MGEYRHVLVALDLEDAALPDIGERGEEVLRAAGQAAAREARLIILHALPVNPGAPMSAEAVEQALLERERLSRIITDALGNAVERLTGRDPAAIEVLVEDGPADRAILDLAAQRASDLIVTGHSCARGKDVLRRLLGSVATAVAREAPCSVLIVRARTRQPERGSAARR
jgi:nucleotide-binding universal stress UspA family protein